MGLITKIEDRLGEWVEKPFRDTNEPDPLALEIAIRRTLERDKKDLIGKVFVPHHIDIVLPQGLYEPLNPFEDVLIRSLGSSLSKWATDNKYEMAGTPKIFFRKGLSTMSQISVETSFNSGCHKLSQGEVATGKKPVGKSDCKRAGGGPCFGELIRQDTGEGFRILDDVTIIGRNYDCDISLEDPSVSRIHAAITREYGKFILEDLDSKTGTRLNLARIDKKVLSPGARILIGQTEFLFECPER